jgi:hypothetical protein
MRASRGDRESTAPEGALQVSTSSSHGMYQQAPCKDKTHYNIFRAWESRNKTLNSEQQHGKAQ